MTEPTKCSFILGIIICCVQLSSRSPRLTQQSYAPAASRRPQARVCQPSAVVLRHWTRSEPGVTAIRQLPKKGSRHNPRGGATRGRAQRCTQFVLSTDWLGGVAAHATEEASIILLAVRQWNRPLGPQLPNTASSAPCSLVISPSAAPGQIMWPTGA